MPLAPLVAALLVLAVPISVAAEPRPPRLTMTGNLSAMISLAPVAVARIRGDR